MCKLSWHVLLHIQVTHPSQNKICANWSNGAFMGIQNKYTINMMDALKNDDYLEKYTLEDLWRNSYYTVNYMPYDSFTTDIFKLTPEEMMFELYTDFDALIAEFPRLIRDRKKIYKKKLIESICKEKDIC